jgi:hypothetical protein
MIHVREACPNAVHSGWDQVDSPIRQRELDYMVCTL